MPFYCIPPLCPSSYLSSLFAEIFWMFSDGGHCPSNLKLTGGENARQTGQVSRCVVAQLLLKLNPCCCLQRCLQHGLLTTDSIQHLVILLLLSWTFPAPALGLPICRQEALARLVPSKSTDTEVFGWKTVSNPISQESGGCCLSWNPLPRVAICHGCLLGASDSQFQHSHSMACSPRK